MISGPADRHNGNNHTDMGSSLLPATRRRAIAATAIVLGGLVTGGTVRADAARPSKSISIVVGFAPGGTTAVMARGSAQGLSEEALGPAVIVGSEPGASGNVTAGEVVKTAPDAYTLFVAPASVENANPSLFRSTILPSRDLTPVMSTGRTQVYPVTRPSLEVMEAAEFRKLLAQEGKTLSALIRDRKIIVG